MHGQYTKPGLEKLENAGKNLQLVGYLISHSALLLAHSHNPQARHSRKEIERMCDQSWPSNMYRADSKQPINSKKERKKECPE